MRPEASISLPQRALSMVVPWNGVNYVMFDLTKGAPPLAGNHFVDVTDITDVPAIQALAAFMQLDLSQAAANLFGKPRPSGSKKRLLAVKGKAPGRTRLAAKSGAGPAGMEIAILRPRTVTVTLRFFHYLDESGQQIGTAGSQPTRKASSMK